MFVRRLLAAVDFSEPSRAALRLAARLAGHCAADLHIVYVEDPMLCAAAQHAGVDLSREAQDELALFVSASALPAGLTIHQHVIGGRAANAICDIAAREQVNVLVVGTHGMSGAERLLFGSTAEAVLRRSQVPVLLVPPAWTPPAAASSDLTGTGPVVVAIDFTVGSLEAISAGFQLARTLQTSLELVHVVELPRVIGAWQQHADAAVQEAVAHARTELARLARGLADDLTVTPRVDVGPIVERISGAAAVTADRHPLLVLGRRQPHGHHDVPGAIAHRVVSVAGVPTLMFMATQSGP